MTLEFAGWIFEKMLKYQIS